MNSSPIGRAARHFASCLPAILLFWLASCASVDNSTAIIAPPAPRPQVDPGPSGDLIGRIETQTIRKEDTLVDIARDRGLGYVEVVAANPGVDPWIPPAGANIVLPDAHLLPSGPRQGIVINLADQRLYYFGNRKRPVSYPIGFGRDGFDTPTGTTRVVRKQKAPTWYPTDSARQDDPALPAAVPPGPDNPLGDYALYLDWPSYLIHGTNRPFAIGRRASRGCIRMYSNDIRRLFAAVPVGTPVRIIDQPVKVGWDQANLYLEAHPTLKQAAQIEDTGRFRPTDAPEAKTLIARVAGKTAHQVNWSAVEAALKERRGYPVQIAPVPAPAAATAAIEAIPAGAGGGNDAADGTSFDILSELAESVFGKIE
jgi:L,D-transpeptidase ErfK/SrfK